jgi:hypothetical protein
MEPASALDAPRREAARRSRAGLTIGDNAPPTPDQMELPMHMHGRPSLTRTRRTAAAVALAAIALFAAPGCASARHCGPIDNYTDTFIAIENARYLIPSGRNEVEVVLSLNGRELWRGTVRPTGYLTNPAVDIVYPPSDLAEAAQYTYVLEAGGQKYAFTGPDPLCRFVQIQCAPPGGRTMLRSPDYRPVYL